jgi:molybdate transport system substrate-binding protein
MTAVRILFAALTLGFAGSFSPWAAEGTITVAAASDLKFALEEMIVAFQKEDAGVTVQVSYGSSGNFYSQLSQGAPFDIFFSADISFPARLIESGVAVGESKFTYGIGRIVIWTSTNSPVDPTRSGIESLRHPSVRKIAIANPLHAPYGQAAVAAMKMLGVYDLVKDKLVYGENIAQTAQFVDTGSAEIGIIALSLAKAPFMKERGRYWELPLQTYPRLEQGGVILSAARNRKAAELFRTFVLSDSGKAVLQRYGFFMPNE